MCIAVVFVLQENKKQRKKNFDNTNTLFQCVSLQQEISFNSKSWRENVTT